MRDGYDTVRGTVVICAALDVEYLAVREHLSGPFTEHEERGTLYEVGTFGTNRGCWTVALAQTGAGGAQAGIELERAISVFHPDLVLFVGVAGGRKDVILGDVVIADYVYDYDSGKDTATDYLPRIKTQTPSMSLVNRARQLARDAAWQHRIRPTVPEAAPKAVIKPIAAGSTVVADADSSTARFLTLYCGDAAAVEMEGHGFLHGAYVNTAVEALVVRGISDLLSGKTGANDEQWQPTASRHAAAFAFELLDRYTQPPVRVLPPDPEQAQLDYQAAIGLEVGGEREPGELIEIERLHRKAADAGHADAMARVGLLVEGRLRASLRGEDHATPSAADVEIAKHWYTRSAELGSSFGALYLGQLHEEHFGKPYEALVWYQKAADLGHWAGKERLTGLQHRLKLGIGATAGHTPFKQSTTDRGLTERKTMPANPVHERWIRQEWAGSEPRAIAACLDELADACGGPYGEWGTLEQDEQVAVIGHFSTLQPSRIHLPAVAFEYYDGIGEGNLRPFAADLRKGRAPDAWKLAPVWWRQLGENRVSIQEFAYKLELTMPDYDRLTALLDKLVITLRNEPSPDADQRENLLSLRMISRELATRRERAFPAAPGGALREFSLLLTQEYMRILIDQVAMWSGDNADSIHHALETAVATPFE